MQIRKKYKSFALRGIGFARHAPASAGEGRRSRKRRRIEKFTSVHLLHLQFFIEKRNKAPS
jgi:hypothetical protein